ncbi:LysR substrate-binding domain-containing protein [Myxococcus sp. K15C18031901]|uniref:LysR substrate-binding domain-containing protein n=1 Tax=Myxococcus dinghuensis TaxID=2906761 RepID=UPI0020A7556D|nr:LysR substrate-binding domain-containing protein [Myxococcus dinghuensis]MCP3102846.1 LysR substrate-binding domain-containing protein [Myxococcus dinghuensis]
MHLAPHPFTLRQLQYAVAVAESLSFRKAAARCHVSQPSLSAQLALLEEALGVQLFERDRRRVLPTSAGEKLVERARRILLEADDLLEESRRVGDPFAGTLRVGVIPTVSPYLLPAVAPALRRRFARLTLAWVEEKTEVLIRELDAGSLDAALVALEAEVGDVEREVIAKDPFFLVTSHTHPLGTKDTPATPGELREANVLLLDEGHCLRAQALAFCSRARAHELEFRATSLSTLAQMVASGTGVTLLPALALPTEVRRAELKVRPLAEPVPYRTLALVWRRRSPLTAALRELAGVLHEHYPTSVAKAPRKALRPRPP